MSVEDILRQMGENARRGQASRGSLLGDTISAVSQMPGQIMDARSRAALQAQQQARQDEQLGFTRDANSRANADQLRQDAAAQAEDRLRAGASAIIGAYTAGTPNEPGTNNLEAGIAEARRWGMEDQIPKLQKLHDDEIARKTPKVTQLNPALDTYENGVLKTPGVAKVERAPSPTEASLALLAAQGDQTAVAALAAIRAQHPKAPAAPKAGLWVQRDGQTIRVQEQDIRVGDKPASTREQGRPVTSGDTGKVTEFDRSLDDVARLRTTLKGSGSTGAVAQVGAMMPNVVTEFTGWGADAKKKQAVIDRVKQVIGKALEGGVLRKEDEEKYKKILPTIGDPESIVMTKLDGLDVAISGARARHLENLADSGYDTSKYTARAAKDAAAPKNDPLNLFPKTP